jgi:hypothetical protein
MAECPTLNGREWDTQPLRLPPSVVESPTPAAVLEVGSFRPAYFLANQRSGERKERRAKVRRSMGERRPRSEPARQGYIFATVKPSVVKIRRT